MFTKIRVSAAIVIASLAVGGAAGVLGSTAAAATKKKLPNVVGKNHQAAQDFLQSRGFFNLREKDCSGRGRLLLFDRNWRVVRQSPKAGRRVSTNTAITLCSVKYSD